MRAALAVLALAACGGDDAELAPVPAPTEPPVSACEIDYNRNDVEIGTWRIVYAPGARTESYHVDPAGEWSSQVRVTLDSAGRTTRREVWDRKNGGQEVGFVAETWRYDARGLLLEETLDQGIDGSIDGRIVHERDGEGWLRRTVVFGEDGQIVSERDHFYADGLEVRVELRRDGELVSIFTYEHDALGRPIELLVEDLTNDSQSVGTFEYDEFGWLTRFAVQSDGFSHEDLATFETDRILTRVAISTTSGKGATSTESWTYRYACD